MLHTEDHQCSCKRPKFAHHLLEDLYPQYAAIFETKCIASRVVTSVGGERRNNSDGTVEMWIIADLGPAISLIETYNQIDASRFTGPRSSRNLFMSIVSWFVDSCRSFISSEGITRRYLHVEHASTNIYRHTHTHRHIHTYARKKAQAKGPVSPPSTFVGEKPES